ncbi:hypothetical protein [Serratia marcescens]|uniref:hypothetical protein n=1 Tax=Serratia marcescens TaxID=615 RepID=UPI001EED9E28|nr:hypothetical protein [Serratia marcescens]MCW7561407.1 hypothetical protein [Serratia marcescens]MCW7566390.1 hypothetical protein [Serratia marcescens]MCW7571390.1 hypothetical protein [Serratia marcescens]MCW7576391.1 hypothetical protein [Serratia marcescens]MCW7581391.1 hypothetical protein [Serratia marcescens]
MAAKTKYFAIDANGARHTRTTARTYTHMVVVLQNLDAGRAAVQNETHRKIHVSNYRHYCQEAATPPSPNHGEPAERRAFYNRVAAMTCEEYVQMRISEERARIDEKGGEFANDWADFGWCGRLDLAQKLAAKWAHYGKVEILEAQAE